MRIGLSAALAALVMAAPALAQDSQSLFNGENLDGWVVPEGDGGHWRVVDGVIDYDGRSETPGDKNLWSELHLAFQPHSIFAPTVLSEQKCLRGGQAPSSLFEP